MKSTHLALALAASALVVGCHDHDDVSCPEGDPAIATFTLTPDTLAAGDSMDAMVMVENFELTGEAGHDHDDHTHTESIGPDADTLDSADDAETQCAGGHVHVYLDDLMTNPLTQAVTSEFVLTIPDDVTPGTHTVMGRLHNRDHTILEPQVIAEVDITVQ